MAVRPAHYWLFVLLVIFLVALPKGGIPWGKSPLTFGYILLAGLAPIALIGLAVRRDFSPMPLMNLLIGYIPIAAFALFKDFGGGSAYSLLIYATVFAILPAIVLLAYAPYLEDYSDEEIGACIKWSIRFVVIWGIFNFILFAVAKKFVDIPYVTVNVADVGTIFDKNNRRGSLMKLVSSYNNGNLYGVCMAMMAPIYFYYEKSRVFIAAFCLAMALTLSRTAWAGLIFIFIGLSVIGKIRLNRGYVWIGGAMIVAIVIAILPYMGWTGDRVVDTNLGGRFVQWQDLQLSVFGAAQARVSEILYAGLLQSFGLFGTALALVALLFPIVYGLIHYRDLSLLRRCALVGMIAYLLVAFSDSAFIYPPTIVHYLFLAALLYRKRGSDPAKDVATRTVASVGGPRRGGLTLAQAAANVR